MNSASRTWLAVILCMGVWFAYMKWFAPPPPVHPQTSSANSTQTAVDATPVVSSQLFTSALRPKGAHTIATSKIEVAFSDVGGKISQVRLPLYKETTSKDSPPITLFDAPTSPHMLAALFTDTELAPLGAANFARSDRADSVQYKATQSGVGLQKEYVYKEGSYVVEATYKLSFPANAKRDWGYLVLPVGAKHVEYEVAQPLKHWDVVALQNDAVHRKNYDAIEAGQKVTQGNSSWVAFGNRYFASVLINGSTLNPDFVLAKEGEFTGGYFRYPLQLKEGQKEIEIKHQYFLGPKDLNELGKLGGLKELVDYGMFKALAYPFLELLKFFFKYVNNYGVAIILLTLAVRIAVYPLALKSFKSMKAMQKLQPQLTALKEKCGEDREKFSREQIALYRTHKINPLGGCLPILVQMPVFFALYAVLANSIELFHAPFMLWIHDLSAKDPLYIFPVLVGVVMFIQQKMTPMVGMDPMQQKMMYLMPLIIVIPTISLPAGLALYWFASSVMGVLQQWLMTRESRAATAKVMTTQSAPEKT